MSKLFKATSSLQCTYPETHIHRTLRVCDVRQLVICWGCFGHRGLNGTHLVRNRRYMVLAERHSGIRRRARGLVFKHPGISSHDVIHLGIKFHGIHTAKVQIALS